MAQAPVRVPDPRSLTGRSRGGSAGAAELGGDPALAASLRATVDAGYDVSALPAWLAARGRPLPWIDARRWPL